MEYGYEVVLVGRQLPHSPSLPVWPWTSVRMKLLFRSGPLFYFFFQLRLLFFLLRRPADLLFVNDLDTLAPNYLIARWKKIPIIYDSHELFCEVPELLKTPLKRKMWQWLEKKIVPNLKYCITVNESIAQIFNTQYKTSFVSVRNIPPALAITQFKSRAQLQLPENKKIILLQGAGINIDRGAEELLEAMKYLDQVLLLVIGSGDCWPKLQKIADTMPDKIRMINRLPKDQLLHYTHNADLGLSIDKDTNLNYRYSLPNKFFDYIQAGIPILSSRLPEIEKLMNQYGLGTFISSHKPSDVASDIRSLLASPLLPKYKENALMAAEALNWDKEKIKLLEIIRLASEAGAHE